MANKFKYNSFREANEAYRQQEIQQNLPEATTDMVISKIPLSCIIESNENQGMSMDGIDDLMASILDVGLQQPLVVVPAEETGMYRILSGHRRFRAFQQLAQENSTFAAVPCYVRDLNSVVLPLPKEDKELYILATTNAEARQLTAGDRMAIVRQLTEVYRKLHENGYKGLGNRRTFLADKMKLSESHVQRIDFVDRNIAPEFREAIEEDQIPLTVANSIAHLPAEQQTELASRFENEELPTTEDVAAFIQEKSKPKIKRPDLVAKTYEITPATEIAEISEKMQSIDAQINVLTLKKRQYARLLELKRIILEKMEEMQQIIGVTETEHDEE